MKRFAALILALVMACSLLAGCGSKTNDDSNTPSDGWAPKGAVTVICPYGAGGGQDICARIFAKYAERYCGVSFVIDNITGGSATIGNTAIANAKTDGQTLGIFTNLAYYDATITEGVAYTTDSFKQLINMCGDGTIIVARKSLGVTDMKGLMDLAASQKVIWGGPEFAGQTLPRMSLEALTGITFDHMIFDGGSSTLAAILGNNCDVTAVFPSEYASVADEDGIVAIAYTGEERLESYPDLPTVQESGYDVSFYMLRSICAPAGVSEEVAKYYTEKFEQVLNDPDFQKDMKEAGFSLYPLVGDATYDYMMEVYNAQIDNVKKAASQG